MKNKSKIIVAVVLSLSLLAGVHDASLVSADAKFKDVSTLHWANNAIQSAVSKGYFKGYSDGSFKPNAPVTREEFAVLMARVSNNDHVNDSVELKDVTGRWSESGVSEAIAKGFVDSNTYVKNGFKPQQAITRVEMVRWMVAGLEVKDEDYKQAVSDTMSTIVPVAEYYKGGLSDKDYGVVSVALGTGLMNGYSDGKFNASKTTTRAEVAAILLRYEQVQDKKAKEYQQLEELREVGLTGSNAESMNMTPTLQSGRPETLERFRGVEFTLYNGKGTASIHNLIFVDPKDKNSQYHKMFIGEGTRYQIEDRKLVAFVLVKGKPDVFLNDYAHWLNGFASNGWAIRYKSESVEKYGLPVIPQENPMGNYLKKDKETPYWSFFSR